MTKSWRPEGWDGATRSIIRDTGILPPQTTYPIVIPSSIEWDILKKQLFEAGADAMLKALTPHLSSFFIIGEQIGKAMKLKEVSE